MSEQEWVCSGEERCVCVLRGHLRAFCVCPRVGAGDVCVPPGVCPGLCAYVPSLGAQAPRKQIPPGSYPQMRPVDRAAFLNLYRRGNLSFFHISSYLTIRVLSVLSLCP